MFGTDVLLTFLDTGGHYPGDKFASYISWADVILLFYSVTDSGSLIDAVRIGGEIRKLRHDNPVALIIVGAKCDEDERMRRVIPERRNEQLAAKLSTPFFIEISSKSGHNITQLVLKISAIGMETRRRVSSNMQRLAPLIVGFNDGLSEELAVAGRAPVKDSPVAKISRSTTSKKHERHLWLFNDLVVYTKPRQTNTGAAVFCGCIPLQFAVALDSGRTDPSTNRDSGHMTDAEQTFAIARIDTREVIEFVCRSRSDKDDWLDRIDEILYKYAMDDKRLIYAENIALFHAQFQSNHLTNRRVFGVPLRYLMKKQGGEAATPTSISRIMDWVLRQYPEEPGLFRLPGFDSIHYPRSLINAGNELDLASYDVLTLCSLVEAFFKQLPGGLIPFEFTAILTTLRSIDSKSDKINRLREVLFCMSRENLALLSETCRFLRALTCHSDRNLVTLQFAAKLFGPILIRARETSVSVDLAHLLIDGAQQIFTEWPTFRKKKMVPGPDFIVQINTDRVTQRIEVSRSQLLRLVDFMRGAPKSEQGDVEMVAQELVTVLNTLASYELTFAREMLDSTNLDNFYIGLVEVEKKFRELQRKATSRLNLFTGGSGKNFSQVIKAAAPTLRAELEQFYSYLDTVCNWTAEEREAYFKLKKKNDHAMQVKQAVGLAVEQDDSFTQSFKMIENLFSDSTARTWWDQNFGLERFNVSLDDCIICLTRFCGAAEFTEKQKRIFVALIDPDRRGVVNIHRFAQFLGVFGPIKSSMQNFTKLLSEPWFYGFLSEQDSRRLLETEHQGAFLMRFASTAFGDLAADYMAVGPNGPEMKTMKVSLTTQGFSIVDAPIARYYGSFELFHQANEQTLSRPFNTDIVRQPFFHGELTNKETEEIMHGAPEGSYLARFSSAPRCLIVSWIAEGGVLYHFKVERFAGTTQLQQGTTIYPGIDECIKANERWLQRPLSPVRLQRSGSNASLHPPRSDSGGLDITAMAGSPESAGMLDAVPDEPSRHAVAAVVEKVYDGANISATNIFLLTYRAFTTPSEVLEILRERYRGSDRVSRLRISNFLKIWITNYFWDVQGEDDKIFFDKYRLFVSQDIVHDSETLSAQLLSVLQKQLANRGASRGRSSLVDSAGQDRNSNSNRAEQSRADAKVLKRESWTALRSSMMATSTGIAIARTAEASTLNLLDIDPVEMARQITLMEHELFYSIQPWEFLNQGWLKRDKERRSPNLLKMIRFSNKISCWVVSEIVAEETLKKRTAVLEYFVAVCKELRAHRNFNGVMEILAGLSNASVYRLKKTWENYRMMYGTKRSRRGVLANDIDDIQRISNTDDNWSVYRQILASAPPPKIPYLGLVLTDLVYCEEGNPSKLPNGDINWTRCERISDLLQGLKLAQDQSYQFTSDMLLVDYVLEFVPLSDNDSHARSLQVEPRDGLVTSTSSSNLMAGSPKTN
eukprot:TRINITY_DN253_c0_g1_i2.p1 TRINITY_DN253_c0_g1~~TRINITY_DN253_c0_g1_i2.p1  ORF type:complete len:1439 (-),score=252.12 TRINITY_DN253_c0_g1_i2:189-4505(-)